MNTLTVFWEGTANTLNPPTTQIGPYFFRCRFLVTAMYIPGLFAAATQAVDISADEPLPLLTTTAPAHFKMAFDGCAVTHGMTGLLFAAGLRSQTRWVKRRIEQILQVYGSPVRCNVLGLSRGGVAAIFLGQACEEFKKSQVELNLLLFDPVPGDQTWSGFPWSGAYGKDLTRCACLSRVLAIYPHEPLPDITFHAPILVAVSSDVDFEEDVTLGCHQGALFATRRSNHSVHCASNLSFRRIVNFFDDVGT